MHRFALFATLAFAAWPVAYSNNPENQPIVEVSLAPPEKCLNLERQRVRRSPKVFDGVRRPLPEVAAEIALLDAEREKLEARGTDLVQSAAYHSSFLILSVIVARGRQSTARSRMPTFTPKVPCGVSSQRPIFRGCFGSIRLRLRLSRRASRALPTSAV